MFSVSYHECNDETYLLASGDNALVDIFRLGDFRENGFTSRVFFDVGWFFLDAYKLEGPVKSVKLQGFEKQSVFFKTTGDSLFAGR